MKKAYLLIIILGIILASCAEPEPEALPSFEEVTTRRDNPTPSQVKAYCEENGGHYEYWKNKNGSYSTYCIFPQGYGCEPEKFWDGSCSMETF